MIQQFYFWVFFWREKTLTWKNICTTIFTAILFKVAEKLKQLKCLLDTFCLGISFCICSFPLFCLRHSIYILNICLFALSYFILFSNKPWVIILSFSSETLFLKVPRLTIGFTSFVVLCSNKAVLWQVLVGMQTGAVTVESSMGIPQKKLKMDLPYDPAIPLLGIYPKKPETLIWKNISTSVFIAMVSTIGSPSVHQ